MSEPYRIVSLGNGLSVRFYDFSNRYYGDFHRVCIEVKIDIPVQLDRLPAGLADGGAKLSSPQRFERRLERMGVSGGELQAVKIKLVEDFLSASSVYLNRPDFGLQFIKRKLTVKAKQAYLRD